MIALELILNTNRTQSSNPMKNKKKALKTAYIMNLVALIAFLMVNISSYSQNTYPKQIVIDGDTIVALKMGQVKNINATFEKLNSCNDMLIISEDYIRNLNSAQEDKDRIIADYRGQITDLSELNTELNGLVQDANNRVELAEKGEERVRKNTKIYTILSFVAGVLTVTLLN